MTNPTSNGHRRILIIDDNPAIHDDFRKVLPGAHDLNDELASQEAMLFGSPSGLRKPIAFEVHSATQGQEGLAMIEAALAEDKPYAMAFVDGRMPPGWDGIETVSRIWKIYPDLQVVICTAYADYSWDEMLDRLGHPDRLVILKKPFDTIEVRQLAYALTEKWQLLQEVKRKVQGLEDAVNDRTAHLKKEIAERNRLEEQLRQAQKMECIGRLAGGIAHDFNNLLTVIEGYAALLLGDRNLKGIHSESIQEISFAAERAAGLTRQLLTFSRKQVFQLADHDLNKIIRDLSKMLQRILGEDIFLNVQFSGRPAMIHADRGMIEQVVMNLAVNSRDAMPCGGNLTIRISPLDVDETAVKQNPEARVGKFLSLCVQDTGSGISEENLPRIFEPFFTTKEAGKGTGLGLATVYGIVKQHHGWITTESKPQVGTAFSIVLPITDTVAPVPKEETVTLASTTRASETILLVEDESTLRKLVEMVLGREGYQVLTAQNGREAMNVWQKDHDRIHLLLTDIVMPDGISGWDLVAHVRNQKPDLKIILTSGYNPGIGLNQKTLRELPYLQKPFLPRTLIDLVRECLDDKLTLPKSETESVLSSDSRYSAG